MCSSRTSVLQQLKRNERVMGMMRTGLRRHLMHALLLAPLFNIAPGARAQGPDLQFELCVKQFDEFRDRFNGKYNAPPDPTGTATMPDRRTLLKSLMGTAINDSTAASFMDEVLAFKPDFALRLDGEPWFAHVRCGVQNGADTLDASFWLVRENENGAHKWSILSTDLRPHDRDRSLYLDSRGHETGFTDLLRPERLRQHGVAPYIGPPGVAALFTVQEALTEGLWRITAVRAIRMHLLQVPGWYAEVAYQPPPAETGWIPSGWNVVRLERMGDRLKPLYIWNHVLGL